MADITPFPHFPDPSQVGAGADPDDEIPDSPEFESPPITLAADEEEDEADE